MYLLKEGKGSHCFHLLIRVQHLHVRAGAGDITAGLEASHGSTGNLDKCDVEM